jgi:hypothetical protein
MLACEVIPKSSKAYRKRPIGLAKQFNKVQVEAKYSKKKV